jgi:excisionase family DNA binding protein
MADSAVPVELYTVPQTAAAFQVTRVTIYNLINAGQLRTVHVGRAVRIRRDDVLAYIEANTSDGEKPARQRRRAKKAAA